MRVFITGTAGFIGFHLAELLLQEGFTVHGFDGMTDYYDVALKRDRHALLGQHPRFTATEALLEDDTALQAAVDACAPDVIVHLAAQAGVRYSIENPRAYVEANIIGSFNVMEAALRHKVRHLLMASTSSVYGANTEMPYAETHKADTQMSFYAATKKRMGRFQPPEALLAPILARVPDVAARSSDSRMAGRLRPAGLSGGRHAGQG